MTRQKKPQLRKEYLFQKTTNSLRRILLRNNNNFYPIVVILIVGFSSLHISTDFSLIDSTIATIPPVDQNYQINAYVEPTLIAQYPSDRYTSGLGFAMRDNYIYSSIGNNPTIIDVSNNSNPTFIAEYTNEQSSIYALVLQDNYMYLGGYSGLEILNISDFDSITKVGSYNNTGDVRALALQEDYAYLAAGSNGLVIVNISDPTQPVEVGCFNDGGDTWDVALKGSLAFVTDSKTTLDIINISDPQNPVKISHFEDEVYDNMRGLSITLNDSYAYLGTSHYGLFILDITDITHPVRIGHYYGKFAGEIGNEGNEEFITSTYVNEKYVFETAAMNGLYILDASDPSNPILIGQYTSHNILYGVFLHESYLYLQTSIDGIRILNLTFHSGNPPRDYSGLILTLIIVPIVGVVIILPLFLKYKRKKKMEKMVNLFRSENTKK